jgi:hypothetical protein
MSKACFTTGEGTATYLYNDTPAQMLYSCSSKIVVKHALLEELDTYLYNETPAQMLYSCSSKVVVKHALLLQRS